MELVFVLFFFQVNMYQRLSVCTSQKSICVKCTMGIIRLGVILGLVMTGWWCWWISS